MTKFAYGLTCISLVTLESYSNVQAALKRIMVLGLMYHLSLFSRENVAIREYCHKLDNFTINSTLHHLLQVKTSGVVSYDVCNVNSGGMMDRDTGHATVAVAGDYFLAFSANLVSSNAQAVWCALYRQPVGVDEGWQVLGMINNYQRGGDGVDDRDSGAMAIVASLEEGDQVWIEWRGYGESFLYSNPYRLISFTGFMLKKKT